MEHKQVSKAWNIAKKAHKKQLDKKGKPYIRHIEGVMSVLSDLGINDEKSKVLAILHDVIEDCDIEYHLEIRDEFSDEIFNKLKILTHHSWDTYQEYIDTICRCNHKDVIIVKITDTIQNLTDAPSEKQKKKYRKSLPRLLKVMWDDKI